MQNKLNTQAKENGLVDVIGGLETAIEIAAKKIKATDFAVSEYPQRKEKPWEYLLNAFEEKANIDNVLKENTGKYYEHFKSVYDISKSSKIQARIPYILEIY